MPPFLFCLERALYLRLPLRVSVSAITIATSIENTIILTPPTLKTTPPVPGGAARAVKRNNPVPIKERIATAPETAKTINRISARLCRVINLCFR